MIRSFGDKETALFYQRNPIRRLPPDIQRTALRKLAMKDAAHTLNDLKVPPGNRLEPLKRSRVGQYSIRINDQWRICFRWERGNAFEVEITDYH